MATVTRERSYIDPTCLYTLRGFQQAAGISATRLREARRQGISVPMIRVGRRKFIKGEKAIELIERLAETA